MANKLINMAIQTTNWAIGLLKTGSAAEARTYLGVGGGGGGGAVDSVNGQTGEVTLDAADVGAAPAGAPLSSFANDVGFITDADIPGSPVISVNNKSGVVVLSASDVGAATAAQGNKADTALQPGDIPTQSVTSVNSKTGAVTLSASDVGAATTAQGTKADNALQSVPSRLDGSRGYNTDPHPDELISICANGLGNPKPALEVWADDGVTQANISVTTYGVNGGGIMHSRMANGTRAAPTAVTAEQIYGGYGARPYHTGGDFFASSPVSIHWVAKELQQPNSKGGALRILTTPIGGNNRKVNTSFAPDGDLIVSESLLDRNPYPALSGRGLAVVRSGAIPAVAHTMQFGGGGNPVSGFSASCAQGTAEAPLATIQNQSAYFGFFGHNGTSFTSSAGLTSFRATANWTPSSTPCRWSVELTAPGSVARREVLAVAAEGFMYVANAQSVPTGSVGSGGYLYVEGGALKFRGGNGTVTTIAPA
ncbi:tail fiber protein [Xanthomonas phage XAJ24]|uniref:Tail fiber protein n=1 Tax=Xanthomonas phage XAJ24 TaxID=1775250 RepID=A0A1I9L2D3_9CAUD|nr:tail fiber protein [Xanthomonas phage XAJ24]AMW36120.1 hypothetical protein [Xanthomonas phage XAJ24]